MTNQLPDLRSDLERRLTMARELYADLSHELRTSIEKLRDGHDCTDDVKLRQTILRQHLAQLQMVLDLEGKLDKYSALTGDGGLDLESARTEIGERLARLRAAGDGG